MTIEKNNQKNIIIIEIKIIKWEGLDLTSNHRLECSLRSPEFLSKTVLSTIAKSGNRGMQNFYLYFTPTKTMNLPLPKSELTWNSHKNKTFSFRFRKKHRTCNVKIVNIKHRDMRLGQIPLCEEN